MFARDTHEQGQSGAGSDEHRVEVFFIHQFADGDGFSDNDVRFEVHSHCAHVIDLLANDLLRQAELRDAIDKDAAEFVQSLKDVNFVTFLDQITGCGQSRGAAAHDRDSLSRRGRSFDISEVEMALLVVGDEALKIAHAQRFRFLAHQTTALAMVFLWAYPARNGRKDVVFANLCRRPEIVSSNNQLDELFHLYTDRTLVYAGRLCAFQATLRLSACQFFGISLVHFFEIDRAQQGRLFRHMLPRYFHAFFQGQRIP